MKKLLSYGVLTFFLLLILIPVVFTVLYGKSEDYVILLTEKEWFIPKMVRSLLYAFAIGAGAAVLSFLTAFALYMHSGRCSGRFLTVLVFLMLMPPQTTLLPEYMSLRDMGLLNTTAALILPMLFSPLAILLMVRYMETVQKDCVDAALLETGSVIVILFKIMLPQMRSCVAAVFVLMFAEGFNMVEQPLYFVREDALKPISVVGEMLSYGENGLWFPVGTICMIPVMVLTLFYHRQLSQQIEGIRE